MYCGIFFRTLGSVFVGLTLGLVFSGARAGPGDSSGFRVDLALSGLLLGTCFLNGLFAVAGAFWLALLVSDGPVSSPGTCLGTAAVPRGGAAAALAGVCAFALAVTSLLFKGVLVVFGTAGEAGREMGVGVLVCGADIGTLIGVPAGLGTILTLLAPSRRRREAGEPGRRCVKQERWLAPDGGRASLEMGTRVGAVTGRGAYVEVGEVEGLGNLEDGSGQTGLLGWAAGPRRDGLRFTLEAGQESWWVEDGAEDGVRALRGT